MSTLLQYQTCMWSVVRSQQKIPTHFPTVQASWMHCLGVWNHCFKRPEEVGFATNQHSCMLYFITFQHQVLIYFYFRSHLLHDIFMHQDIAASESKLACFHLKVLAIHYKIILFLMILRQLSCYINDHNKQFVQYVCFAGLESSQIGAFVSKTFRDTTFDIDITLACCVDFESHILY